MSVEVELVEGLIFDGLLEIASRRFAVAKPQANVNYSVFNSD